MENNVQMMNVGQGAKSKKYLKGKAEIPDKKEAQGGGKRPKRDVRPSNNLKSPFVRRGTELSGRQITSEEEAIWQWLFKDKRNNNEHIYAFVDKLCTKELFQSLKYNSWVEGSVIDCWTYCLNDDERLKSPSSPLRLFFTVESTVVAIGHSGKSNDERYSNLLDHIDMVISTVNYQQNRNYTARDFDMHLSWEIIDNVVMSTDYGDVPRYLVSA
ncbi:hypothetical protein POM88_044946 [Heracleum sosnowskyi]|uniref:Uncharacterized protein n=1 Tax=Heracleum sosnowskyi TaxID=360622 RepID=A0AAD8H3P4_9APIA|nr:hypothetical protein POM88_044946 [Heracleum sosnowskyi]